MTRFPDVIRHPFVAPGQPSDANLNMIYRVSSGSDSGAIVV
jgi:hypothetical protein